MALERIALVPLDGQILRTRLDRDEFVLDRVVSGRRCSLRFGAEFPGAGIDLYQRFLDEVHGSGVVEGTYVVVDTEAAEAIGQIGTVGPPTGEAVEIGYGINPAHQGRGVATTALGLLLAELARDGRSASIVARTASDNPASGRVLEHNGFAVTGREITDEGEILTWALRPA